MRFLDEAEDAMATNTSPPLAEIQGEPIANLPASVWSMLDTAVERDPDQLAVIAMHQSATYLGGLLGPTPPLRPNRAYLECSYGQMRYAARRWAWILSTSGVQEGDVLMTFVPNGVEWCLAMWTTALAKLVFVPLDLRLLEQRKTEELRFFLDRLKPSVILVADQAGAATILSDWILSFLKLGIIVKLDETARFFEKPWVALEDLVLKRNNKADKDLFLNPSPPNLDRVALIIFTSGTSTGTPKGCVHTESSLLHQAHSDFGLWRPGEKGKGRARSIWQTANFRMVCTSIAYATWSNGDALVIPATIFSPTTSLKAIETCGVTFMFCVPLQLFLFGEDASYSREKVKSLRQVFIGGDVVTAEILHKAETLFPDAVVVCVTGMTEGAGVIGWPEFPMPSIINPNPTKTFQGIVSCGTAFPGGSIRVVSSDDSNNILKRGEVGELHVSSKAMIEAYLDNARPKLFYESSEGKTKKRWVVTGDKAVIDADGNVFVVGRSKDIIKRAGVPIAPAAVEACLAKKFDLKTQVIGHPDEKLGEQAFAVIETPSSSSSSSSLSSLISDIEASVIEKFGKEYALGGVLTLQQLGMTAWPVNASGKVPKNELREAAVRYLGTTTSRTG